MEAVIANEQEKDRVIGYNGIYRYETFEIKLEYDTITEKWTIGKEKYHSEDEEKLNSSITRMNEVSWVDMGYTLEERIERILQLLDHYFSGESSIRFHAKNF